jgi:hypothetical protein
LAEVRDDDAATPSGHRSALHRSSSLTPHALELPAERPRVVPATTPLVLDVQPALSLVAAIRAVARAAGVVEDVDRQVIDQSVLRAGR